MFYEELELIEYKNIGEKLFTIISKFLTAGAFVFFTINIPFLEFFLLLIFFFLWKWMLLYRKKNECMLASVVKKGNYIYNLMKHEKALIYISQKDMQTYIRSCSCILFFVFFYMLFILQLSYFSHCLECISSLFSVNYL